MILRVEPLVVITAPKSYIYDTLFFQDFQAFCKRKSPFFSISAKTAK
jgi:hypothetical protein